MEREAAHTRSTNVFSSLQKNSLMTNQQLMSMTTVDPSLQYPNYHSNALGSEQVLPSQNLGGTSFAASSSVNVLPYSSIHPQLIGERGLLDGAEAGSLSHLKNKQRLLVAGTGQGKGFAQGNESKMNLNQAKGFLVSAQQPSKRSQGASGSDEQPASRVPNK